MVSTSETASPTPKKASPELRSKFERFKWKYTVLYVVLMLSDWIQGTNMYTLYKGYGVDIGQLFLTGFAASAVFSCVMGPYIDYYGRKKACILYCLGEVVINILEHSTDMTTLLVGRVIGGLTTALLFTSFESWMVTAHRGSGFQEEWLKETFAVCSIGNGIVAVFSGLISQVMADWLGDIGPFKLAVVLSGGIGIAIAFMWEENYGQQEGTDTTMYQAGIEALMAIRNDKKIMLAGAIQALFQGAMFTFVFMWVPVMGELTDWKVPTGLVYASLMAAIAIGGSILPFLEKHATAEVISTGCFAVAVLAMLAPVIMPNLHVTFAAFLVFEACVGVNDGTAGVVRSKYIPDTKMAAILNIFRVPLNVLVVVGTKMNDTQTHATCFLYCALCHALTTGLAAWLFSISGTAAEKPVRRGKKKSKKGSKKGNKTE